MLFSFGLDRGARRTLKYRAKGRGWYVGEQTQKSIAGEVRRFVRHIFVHLSPSFASLSRHPHVSSVRCCKSVLPIHSCASYIAVVDVAARDYVPFGEAREHIYIIDQLKPTRAKMQTQNTRKSGRPKQKPCRCARAKTTKKWEM